MGERTLSALFSWNKQNKGEKGMLSGQITCHQPCLLELSFLCGEEWPYSREGEANIKGEREGHHRHADGAQHPARAQVLALRHCTRDERPYETEERSLHRQFLRKPGASRHPEVTE